MSRSKQDNGRRSLRFGKAAAAAALALTLSACVSTRDMPAGYAGPAARPASLEERFAYEPLDGEASRSLMKETRRYTVHRILLRQSGAANGDGPLEIEYYELPGPGPHPVAMVLPILDGQNRVARQFAGYFAKHGLAAVIVYTRQKDSLLADMSNPEAAIRRTVTRHRQVLDWIEAQAELDSDRMGVFGASLGGFNALFLAAADGRVRAVVPALAGADLPRLMVRSEERRVSKYVDKFRNERGWSDAEMEAYLRSKIDSDPLVLAPCIDANRVLMIIARYDDAIPYVSQLQLRQALGEPEALMLASGHKSTLLYLPYLKWKVLEFFRRQLDFS